MTLPAIFNRCSAAPLLPLLALLSACASVAPPPAPTGPYQAEISRTAGGIPHITAGDWGSLGFGTGYVMAEDNVCILAQQHNKFGARLSQQQPGDATALQSDFFYQLLIDRGGAGQALPPRLERLFSGAASGYNHYLDKTGIDQLPDPACRGADWVRRATSLDWKRVSNVDYALDYMHPMIVAAQPPQAAIAPVAASPSDGQTIALAVEQYMEVPKQGGSNAIAIGGDATDGASSLLMANPHMPWNEPNQRFYPMHQTIAGEIDMLGATLIGRPRVGFGTTEKLAWTSTVSTAKRAMFYRLQLAPGKPTHYLMDGKTHKMREERVTVGAQSHTFYSTHFGALLVASPFFQWSDEHAFAVLLPEVGYRGELSAFEQYAARSVHELKAVHNKYQFLTVNLIAADANGDVMYTDPGPVPNIGDAQMQRCALLHGAALDGSRSDCLWQSDRDAAARGIIGPARLPLIYRRDYVTNSNDSYWLANPDQPLEGFPGILGSERSERTLRTRSGLQMVQELLRDGGRISQQELTTLTLANKNFAGQIIGDDLVATCREQPRVTLEDGNEVDLSLACDVLAAWDRHDNIDSRGAHLLRQTLAAANGENYTRHLPKDFTPAIPFDPAAPIDTPRGLANTSYPTVLNYLAIAVHQLNEAGLRLDARLGDLQHVTRNELEIPLHGGPESTGVFNKIEAAYQGSKGYPDVTSWSSSWIMATGFTEQGPRVKGILTYSLSANPESPWYMDQTRMFSNKQWLDIPFRADEVRAAALHNYQLEAPR